LQIKLQAARHKARLPVLELDVFNENYIKSKTLKIYLDVCAIVNYILKGISLDEWK